jgi:cobalt transporter subunit CbtA
MLQRLLITGLLSGAIAGVVLTLLHLVMLQPLIAEAETFEKSSSAATLGMKHFHLGGLSHSHLGGSQSHVHKKNVDNHVAGTDHAHADVKMEHSHDARTADTNHRHGAHLDSEGWSPGDGLERSFYTLAANILTVIAFGLLMASGFTLYGGSISVLQGLLWGGAGFLSFAFLPGLGLPAELPGSAAGDLFARQAWWLGTASLSLVGLALLAFGQSNFWRVIAALLLIIPHAIGAPQSEAGLIGVSPPELAAHFVMVSLFASAIMWGVLGYTAAYLYARFSVQKSSVVIEPFKV